jgi:Protein of unknown function (DUF3638)
VDCARAQVLQRLEIRPRQLHMAEHLLTNIANQHGNGDEKGAIVQLNMIEGKTRIIIPMLVLALAKEGRGDVVQLNFIGELLPDAVAHLQQTLTGAPLGYADRAMPPQSCKRSLDCRFHLR